MNKKTGTIILGLIALIFGIDTGLSMGSHATISEWMYNFLHNDPITGFGIIGTVIVGLLIHFWFFTPLKK